MSNLCCQIPQNCALAPCRKLKGHELPHGFEAWTVIYDELDSLQATVTTLNAQAEDLVRQRNEGYRQRDENFARAEAAEEREGAWQDLSEIAYRHLWDVRALVLQKRVDVVESICWRLKELESKRAALSAPPAEAGPPVDAWGITISLLNGWASETLEACHKRGWAVDWSRRGAYLFLECAELVESLRGKGDSTPAEELADVFTVLLSIIAAFNIDLSQTFRFIQEKRQKILSGAPPAEAPPTKSEIEKLRAFKSYVHHRLDVAGIPANPEGPHSKQGCRIGDRLDIVLNRFLDATKPEPPAAPKLQVPLGGHNHAPDYGCCPKCPAYKPEPPAVAEPEKEPRAKAVHGEGDGTETCQGSCERKAWMDTAAQYCRGADWYRGLLVQIGETFGDVAKTSEDGSVQDSVLVSKVPDLVASLRAQLETSQANEDGLRRTLERISAERDALRTQLEEARAEIADHTTEVELAEEKWEGRLLKEKQETEIARAAWAKVASERDALKRELEEARAKAEGLRARLTTAGFERASFREEGQRLRAERDAFRAQLEEAKTRLEQLVQGIDAKADALDVPRSLCPEHGPDVGLDEDGCCSGCGCFALLLPEVRDRLAKDRADAIAQAREEERAKTWEEAIEALGNLRAERESDAEHAASGGANSVAAAIRREDLPGIDLAIDTIRARSTETHPWAELDKAGPLPSSFLAVAGPPLTETKPASGHAPGCTAKADESGVGHCGCELW